MNLSFLIFNVFYYYYLFPIKNKNVWNFKFFKKAFLQSWVANYLADTIVGYAPKWQPAIFLSPVRILHQRLEQDFLAVSLAGDFKSSVRRTYTGRRLMCWRLVIRTLTGDFYDGRWTLLVNKSLVSQKNYN